MTNPAGPTILVVEDETFVRMETVDFFVDAGFVVIEAWNAAMALLLIEQHPEIQLVFTDVDMPGTMCGLALAKMVSTRWPAMAIMICSGPVDLAKKRLPNNAPFFSKPYDMQRASLAAHQLIAA